MLTHSERNRKRKQKKAKKIDKYSFSFVFFNFCFVGSLVSLISYASGLHKHLVDKQPECVQNTSAGHKKDFYGLFYSIIAEQLRNSRSFDKMLKCRASIPIFSSYISNLVNRAPRLTTRKNSPVTG